MSQSPHEKMLLWLNGLILGKKDHQSGHTLMTVLTAVII